MITKSTVGIGLLILSSAHAFASGNGAGNGGGALVCFSNAEHTNIVSIESFDIWEGSVFHTPRLPNPVWNGTDTKDKIIQKAMKKIALYQPGVADEMDAVLKELNTPGFVIDVAYMNLATVPDVHYLAVPTACEYRQMVNWLDPGDYMPGSGETVLRDETYYNSGPVHMDPLSQASLDLHEAAYKVLRTHQPEITDRYGSKTVRKFIAEAISDSAFSAKLVAPHLIDPGFYDYGESGSSFSFSNMEFIRPKACTDTVQITISYLAGPKLGISNGFGNDAKYMFAMKPGEVRTFSSNSIFITQGTNMFHSFSDKSRKFLIDLKACGFSFQKEVDYTAGYVDSVGILRLQ